MRFQHSKLIFPVWKKRNKIINRTDISRFILISPFFHFISYQKIGISIRILQRSIIVFNFIGGKLDHLSFLLDVLSLPPLQSSNRSIRNFHVPEVWQFPPTFQSRGRRRGKGRIDETFTMFRVIAIKRGGFLGAISMAHFSKSVSSRFFQNFNIFDERFYLSLSFSNFRNIIEIGGEEKRDIVEKFFRDLFILSGCNFRFFNLNFFTHSRLLHTSCSESRFSSPKYHVCRLNFIIE